MESTQAEVIRAALVTTSASSTAPERSDASSRLERWSNSGGADCWSTFIGIFGDISIIERISFAEKQPSPNEQRVANGAKLLLITLLGAKLRRDYIGLQREQPALAGQVFDCLGNALASLGNATTDSRDSEGDNRAMASALSSALSAAAVRVSSSSAPNEGIMKIVMACNESPPSPFSARVSLQLLADVAAEAQSRTDLTSVQIDALLQMPNGIAQQGFDQSVDGSASDAALDIIFAATVANIERIGEQSDAIICLAIEALTSWASACKRKVTLSKLYQMNRGSDTFLSVIVSCLSSSAQRRAFSSAKYAEGAVIKCCQSMTACVDNSGDYGTQQRTSAVAFLLQSIRSLQFIHDPVNLAVSHGWEDALAALSTLASTLAREEVDVISTCRLEGSTDLIELLLLLQQHPQHNVATPVLEFWLSIQDVPTADRHPMLAGPVFQQLVETILNRAAYPSSFISWDEELDVEKSDFDEFRRLSADVLIGAYFLLRSDYLECLSNFVFEIETTDWEIAEAALWSMNAVAREACARVKSVSNAAHHGRESPVSADGNTTVLGLTEVLKNLLSGGTTGIPKLHPLVLAGVAKFLGSFASIWASSCPPQAILEIIAYLSTVLSVPAATEIAGNSIRLVMISSANKLARVTVSSPNASLSPALVQTMEAALNTNNPLAMRHVAEGAARVSIALRLTPKTRATITAIAGPCIQRMKAALIEISSSSAMKTGEAAGRLGHALGALTSYLGVLKEIIRFCDSSARSKQGEVHVLSDVLAESWPVLNDIAQSTVCRSNEAVLSGLLDVHSQLLGVVPALIGPYIQPLIEFVVKAFEETKCPSALCYISNAVETFDSEPSISAAAGLDQNGTENLFSQLLSHICIITFACATQTARPCDCQQLIKGLFEMTQRYLLFCPGALLCCQQFSSLFEFAVLCLTELKGEVESTRAVLIFLAQLVGWREVRLGDVKMAKLSQHANSIDNLLARFGENLTLCCLRALAGGAPQSTWPAYSDCLFCIMLQVITSAPSSVADPNSILNAWLRAAMTEVTTRHVTQEITVTVVRALLEMIAAEGAKSKQKAKLCLTDFGKIAKGEATSEVLLAYAA